MNPPGAQAVLPVRLASRRYASLTIRPSPARCATKAACLNCHPFHILGVLLLALKKTLAKNRLQSVFHILGVLLLALKKTLAKNSKMHQAGTPTVCMHAVSGSISLPS